MDDSVPCYPPPLPPPTLPQQHAHHPRIQGEYLSPSIRIISHALPKIILTPVGMACVLLATAGLLAGGLYGVSQQSIGINQVIADCLRGPVAHPMSTRYPPPTNP